MSNLKLDVHTSEGKTNGSVDLPAEIFDTEASIALMHQVVNAQLHARAPTQPRPAAMSAVVVASLSVRRAPAVHARAQSAHRITPVAAPSMAHSRATTHSAPLRR